MKLTAAILASVGIAPWDIARFRAVFGDSCEITPENFDRAEKSGLHPATVLALLATEAEYRVAVDRCLDRLALEERIIRERADREIAEAKQRHESERKKRMCDALILALDRLPKGTP